MQTYYYFTNELSHHGIKGQKWGVRRYQNEDGSYTPAGEKRYSVGYDRKGNSQINDAQGNKMKRKDRRLMEKHMVKDLKQKAKSKDNDVNERMEARKQLGEYKSAKKAINSGLTYLGNDRNTAMLTMALNNSSASTRRTGKETVDRMIANYANTYLDSLTK